MLQSAPMATKKRKRVGRPPGKLYPVQVRLSFSKELHVIAKRIAKQERISMSELVRRLLTDYATKRGK